MAKTTTTTKAKTKTTKKKPVAKVAAKTTKTAAKTKRVTKATTKTTKSTIKAASTPKVTNTKAVTPLLNRPQVLLGGLFAALAVAAGFLINTTSVQVLLGHLTKDELASRAGTVLAPAAHAMYEVEFRWLLVSFLVLASVFAILRGTRYKAVEENGVKNKVQPLRWVDYAVTGSAMFAIAGLMNGLQDLVAIKMSVVALMVAAYLGWVFERENAVNGKPARSIYTASAVLTVVPVAYLLVTMFATGIYGMVRSPWYALVVAFIAAIYLLGTSRFQWNAYKKNYDFAYTDRNFNRLAVVSKLALAVVLITGLYAK